MKERIKELRKELHLSQEIFGERLGVTKASISRLESGVNNVTESMVKLICSEFNVSEDWLRTGEGEMFESIPKDELDKLAARYKLNPNDYKLIRNYLSLSPEQRLLIQSLFNFNE